MVSMDENDYNTYSSERYVSKAWLCERVEGLISIERCFYPNVEFEETIYDNLDAVLVSRKGVYNLISALSDMVSFYISQGASRIKINIYTDASGLNILAQAYAPHFEDLVGKFMGEIREDFVVVGASKKIKSVGGNFSLDSGQSQLNSLLLIPR